MLEKIKTYAILGLAVLLIAGGIWIYNFYNEYQALKLEKEKIQQNELALRDQNAQLADSLTKVTSFVQDLNSKLQKVTTDYVALSARFAAYIDSIHDSGPSIPVEIGDTIRVPFSGEKSIAKYSGYTNYNKLTKLADWYLDITFPIPVELKSTLIEEEGIWKWVSESLTPGIKVRAMGILDSDTYRRLQKYTPPLPRKRFLIGGILGQHGGLGGGYEADDWTFVGYYSLLNKYPDVYKNINLGIFWKPF